MRSTKASINVSIEAIIIIVLAMTLLGLGLSFIRGQFGQITTVSTEVQEQVREQIIGQLRTSGEKVSFPRSIQFNRNEQKVVTLGVQNTGSSTINFKLDLGFDPTNSDVPTGTASPQQYLDDLFDIRYQRDCLSLPPSAAEVYGINVRAPTIPGTFALRANITQFTDTACTTVDPLQTLYASKLSFITVG